MSEIGYQAFGELVLPIDSVVIAGGRIMLRSTWCPDPGVRTVDQSVVRVLGIDGELVCTSVRDQDCVKTYEIWDGDRIILHHHLQVDRCNPKPDGGTP